MSHAQADQGVNPVHTPFTRDGTGSGQDEPVSVQPDRQRQFDGHFLVPVPGSSENVDRGRSRESTAVFDTAATTRPPFEYLVGAAKLDDGSLEVPIDRSAHGQARHRFGPASGNTEFAVNDVVVERKRTIARLCIAHPRYGAQALQNLDRINVDFDRSPLDRLIARQEWEPGVRRQRQDPLIEGRKAKRSSTVEGEPPKSAARADCCPPSSAARPTINMRM